MRPARHRIAALRAVLAAALLLSASACSGTGLNAGEDGGLAWIAFSVMLLITLAILYFAFGRSE